MITRLELDGFKTFAGFAVDVAAFQAIVGPVGAGASNVLDAITLLAGLADADTRTAFDGVRGGAADLFTKFPDGSSAPAIRLAVEMLTDAHVEDSWGVRCDIRYTRLRYEVTIVRRADARGNDRLVVTHEALIPIQRSADQWARRHLGRGREHWLPPLRTGRTVPFISTVVDERGSTLMLHQDGRGGDMSAVAHGAERTALSTVANTEFPHAFAAREQMRRWRTLSLTPDAIRGVGSPQAHTFIGRDGGNLVAALARMKSEQPGAIERVADDLRRLAPGIAALELDERAGFYRQRLSARLQDGRELGMAALSDAELRMLAVAVVANDPDEAGVLCFDEPENGLDLSGLMRLATYLPAMSTNLTDVDGASRGLRQIIVTTHSLPLADELARVLCADNDEPLHTLPELMVAYRRAQPGSVAVPAFTVCEPVSPSQQLGLGLEEIAQARNVVTMNDVARLLRIGEPPRAWVLQ